jgi:hypothetical protein
MTPREPSMNGLQGLAAGGTSASTLGGPGPARPLDQAQTAPYLREQLGQ